MIDQTDGWNEYYRRGRLAHMPELFVVRFFRALRNRGDFLKEHNVDDWIVPDSIAILDFGCGNGRHTIFLKHDGWAVTACDISSRAVALLAETLQGDGDGPRIDVISHGLPYQDRSFDIVIAHGVFDHIPKDGRSDWTSEVARVLKNNGLLYASFIADSAHAEESARVGEVVLEEGEEAGLTQTFYTPEMIVSEYGRLFDIRSIAYDNRGLVYPARRIIEHRFWAIFQLKRFPFRRSDARAR